MIYDSFIHSRSRWFVFRSFYPSNRWYTSWHFRYRCFFGNGLIVDGQSQFLITLRKTCQPEMSFQTKYQREFIFTIIQRLFCYNVTTVHRSSVRLVATLTRTTGSFWWFWHEQQRPKVLVVSINDTIFPNTSGATDVTSTGRRIPNLFLFFYR